MFENKYPYTNFHELNLDWVLGKVSGIENTIEELNERYSSFDKLLDEAKAYTDDVSALYDEQLNTVKADITTLSDRLNAEIRLLSDTLGSEIDTLSAKCNIDHVRLTQKINAQWEEMKDYIASQVIEVKVRNFFTGRLVSAQAMFDYLARFHLEGASSYNEVSGKNTYSHYVAKNETYEHVISNAATFFES